MSVRLERQWRMVGGLAVHARVADRVPSWFPAVALVHGLGVSSRYMAALARELAPFYRVFAVDLPGFGYGLFYQYGLFQQEIDNGYQREKPDRWLHATLPWTLSRPDDACLVPVYGRIVDGIDRKGQYNPMWLDWKILVGVPNEMPVVGFGGRTVNALRLYSAHASASGFGG